MQSELLQAHCAVAYCDEAHYLQAKALATTLNIECIEYQEKQPYHYRYILLYQQQQLALLCQMHPTFKPFHVDFCHGTLGHRLRTEKNHHQPLARAVGIKSGICLTILDITAGFAQDASILANLGCQVTLIERHPIVWALLNDGLLRAQQAKQNWCERVNLLHQDALLYCQQLLNADAAVKPDVIYCDPMFPHTNKTAQVKKQMQLLHMLVGEDDNNAALFASMHQITQKRIVVKRPKSAKPWCDQIPDFTINMIKYRFDVYSVRT